MLSSRLFLLSRVAANRAVTLESRTYMTGPGSRAVNNIREKAFTLKGLQEHKPLQPLVACLGFVVVFTGYYCYRLLVYSPDTNIRKSDPLSSPPQNYYKDKQYKFLNPLNIDHSKCPAPDFTEGLEKEGKK